MGAFKSNMKAPETCHSNISMNFPMFSCFFLNNLFSSYLDPPSSFISADKGADANDCKLLLLSLGGACSNYLTEGKHPKETKSTRDLASLFTGLSCVIFRNLSTTGD